jgi:hypothetical protein
VDPAQNEALLGPYVRAALRQLARRDPGLKLSGRLVAQAPSEGGRNFHFRAKALAGPVRIKVRAKSQADAEREIWGLTQLPEGLGPRLIAAADPRSLLASAAKAGHLKDLPLWDQPFGALIIMEEIKGHHPQGLVPGANVAAFVAAYARLARIRPRTGERTLFPDHPRAIFGLLDERLARIAHHRL